MTTGEPELQIVEVDGHVLLLKRGIHELKLSGEAAARLGAPLKEIAEGTRTVDEVLSVATDEDQEQLNQLLEMLVARGLLART